MTKKRKEGCQSVEDKFERKNNNFRDVEKNIRYLDVLFNFGTT